MNLRGIKTPTVSDALEPANHRLGLRKQFGAESGFA